MIEFVLGFIIGGMLGIFGMAMIMGGKNWKSRKLYREKTTHLRFNIVFKAIAKKNANTWVNIQLKKYRAI